MSNVPHYINVGLKDEATQDASRVAILLREWEQEEERKRLARVKRLYNCGHYTLKQAMERGLKVTRKQARERRLKIGAHA